MAVRRLHRDLVELEQANLSSIAAQPLEHNLFEWHVNIKPADGVYSGVYLHLVMIFPEQYPSVPPEIKIKTPIAHPNVYGEWLCLSMLREHTTDTAYEGWSGAYSATSILMQLQSFLFAEKVDQDEGYQRDARLSAGDVQRSLRVCRQLRCSCGHSHGTPSPAVKAAEKALVQILPTHPKYGAISTQGSACQSTEDRAVGAFAAFECKGGRVQFECSIAWMAQPQRSGCSCSSCRRTAANENSKAISGGRFGFGSAIAGLCGVDIESFGYGSHFQQPTPALIYDNKPMENENMGAKLKMKDTLTVAVDMEKFELFIGVNGKLLKSEKTLQIPEHLRGKGLFPMVSLKQMRVEFNFGTPRKPIAELTEKGFMSLEQIVSAQTSTQIAVPDVDDAKEEKESAVDWASPFLTEWIWLDIFVSLQSPEIFRCRSVCREWRHRIGKFNIMERNEMCCFFTKRSLSSPNAATLGIGLNIAQSASGYGVEIKTQMDILSLAAWTSGVRTGVWGERMTHFLPLVMNRAHSDRAEPAIRKSLELISSKIRAFKRTASLNELEAAIAQNGELQLIDSLVTMMNAIVVQFAMGSDASFVSDYDGHSSSRGGASVPMTLCEKVVLGYSALHHLLLFLKQRNRAQVSWLANESVRVFVHRMRGHGKHICKDLGKLLIYTLLSDYSWRDIAKTYFEESFTRRVKWMMAQAKYAKFDTTDAVPKRALRTFEATQTSRRLAMFQVWFMQKNSAETLQSYNLRLGRPADSVRYGVLAQTKQILSSKSWRHYFGALGVQLKNDAAVDELLRFAVYNSAKKGYHRRGRGDFKCLRIVAMRMPRIDIVGGASADGGAISKPGQCGSVSRVMERVKLSIAKKPTTNPWAARRSKQSAANSKPRYIPPSLRKETAPKTLTQQRPPQQRAVYSNQTAQGRVSRVGQQSDVQQRVQNPQILARAYRPHQMPQPMPQSAQQPYPVQSAMQQLPQSVQRPYPPTPQPQRPQPQRYAMLQQQRPITPQQRPQFVQRQYPSQYVHQNLEQRRTPQPQQAQQQPMPQRPQPQRPTPMRSMSMPKPLQQMAVQSNQATQNRVSQQSELQQRAQIPQTLVRVYPPQQIPQQRYAMPQRPQQQQPSAPQPRPQSVQRPYPQPQAQRPMPQRPSAPQQRLQSVPRRYPTQYANLNVNQRRTPQPQQAPQQQNEPKPSVLPTPPRGISLTPNSTKSTPISEQPRLTRPPITRLQPQRPTPIKPMSMSMSKPLQRMDAQAQARARSQHIMALLHSRKPVQRAQRPQSVSEISSVSAVSSSPSMSNRFAYADSSSKAPSDDTVLSSRSSLSSNSNSVSRGGIYDFRLKRELNANANAQSGIVARQLNAMIGARMSLGIDCNTLGLDDVAADSVALQQRGEVGLRIRLRSDVVDCDLITDCTYAGHSNQAQPRQTSNQAQPMAQPQRSKAQRRKARRKNH